MKLVFLPSSREWRSWLKSHHVESTELLVGDYHKGSGLGGLTYAEALDEALRFGWIDGARKNVDEVSYS